MEVFFTQIEAGNEWEVLLPKIESWKNWKCTTKNWKFCSQKLETGNKLEVLLPKIKFCQKLEAGNKLKVLLPKIGSVK